MKLRQRDKTTIKEPHAGVVMGFSHRTSASTLHIKIQEHKFACDVGKAMHRDTLILLMRMYRSSKKLVALQDYKTATKHNKEQRRIALVLRAGGFARSVTHQNDRFNDNKSSMKALHGDVDDEKDTSNALSKEAIWKTLQSAENNGAIAPGMAKKIFTVLNLGGNGGSDDGSGGNSVNISNTDSFFDSVDQSANDATPDGEIGDKSIGSSKKDNIR